MKTFRYLARVVGRRDRRLMEIVGRWSPPGWVRVWICSASRAGDGWLWVALAIPILWLGDSRRYDVIAVLALSSASGICCFLGLKRLISRPRPCTIAPVGWLQLEPPDRFSFPSGHSITAFAITVPLSMFYPAFWTGLMFCAVSVAFSRIALGLHFMSDVVIGACMGAGIGYAAYTLFV